MGWVCRNWLATAWSFTLKPFAPKLRWFFLFGLVFLFGTNIAAADTHRAQRAFVYGINAAVETGYTGAFAPPSVATIYLLAGTTNILSPRITDIYFWPITNEYKASWELTNEPVIGQLEILRNDRLLQTPASSQYTLQSRSRGTATETRLIIGDEAIAAHTKFIGLQNAYGEAAHAYYDAQQKWLATVSDINKQKLSGNAVIVPPQPRQPEPIPIYSNGLSSGFPVNLIAGTYRIQLRAPDGTIVNDSARALEVFEARRTAIGYEVLPETRWTTPDQVLDPGDAIVGSPNSHLYLIPHLVTEYPALPYSLLQSPQQQSPDGAEWRWILGAPLTDVELLVTSESSPIKREQLNGYKVEQQSGAQLGYSIKPFVFDSERPGLAPDISGFSVSLKQPGDAFRIAVIARDSTTSPESTRLVRVSYPPRLFLLLIPTLVPITLGVIVIHRRRTTARLPRKLLI